MSTCSSALGGLSTAMPASRNSRAGSIPSARAAAATRNGTNEVIDPATAMAGAYAAGARGPDYAPRPHPRRGTKPVPRRQIAEDPPTEKDLPMTLVRAAFTMVLGLLLSLPAR